MSLILTKGSCTGYKDIHGNELKIGDFVYIRGHRHAVMASPDDPKGFRLVPVENAYCWLDFDEYKNEVELEGPTFFQ